MKPFSLRFAAGDTQEALKIMKEAASWLIEKGEPLWLLYDIDEEAFKNPKKDFIVLYEDGQSTAAMILNRSGNGLWPDDKDSVYIHKLAVKREYAGQGYSLNMMEYAIDFCRQKGIRFLRLDCDAKREKLCRLYEKSGFNRVATKHFSTKKYGEMEAACYRIDISGET